MGRKHKTTKQLNPDQRRLVQQIEAVFADAVYPGDECIAVQPNHCPECAEANSFFRGRHWGSLVIVNKLPTAYADLSFLTPEAQRFFLPAYLIQALEDAHDGTRWYSVLKVTPPEEANFQEQFNQFTDGFTGEQCAVDPHIFGLLSCA